MLPSVRGRAVQLHCGLAQFLDVCIVDMGFMHAGV